MNMIKSQLELSFDNSPKLGQRPQTSRRLTRARWWFQQMHAVVDGALDWSTPPDPRPEQISLTLAKAR